MSRILRRPMFRGGRVDSRGTGITSGLSYAKGGSVNTPKRGLVDGPGGYAGDAPGFFKSPVYKGGRWLLDYLGKPVSNVVGEFAVNPIAGLFGYPDLYEQMETPYDYADAKIWNYFGGGKHPIYNPDGDWRTDDTIANKIWADRYNKEKGKGREFVGDELEIVGDPRQPLPDAKPKKKTEAQLALEELEKLLASQTKSRKGAKETIDEYKEVFKDAYGSGVADDASNMLLNFAGKALKPEATVKSAFGEFFEEEGKRPSERKKYKDAATSAAINAYLTGEKSFNDTMKAIELAKATTKAKIDILAEGKGWDDYLIEGAGTGGDPRKMGAISYAVAKMGETLGGKLPELEENQTYGDILTEGFIYVQNSPDGDHKILVKWDGEKLVPIKQVYKR